MKYIKNNIDNFFKVSVNGEFNHIKWLFYL